MPSNAKDVMLNYHTNTEIITYMLKEKNVMVNISDQTTDVIDESQRTRQIYLQIARINHFLINLRESFLVY